MCEIPATQGLTPPIPGNIGVRRVYKVHPTNVGTKPIIPASNLEFFPFLKRSQKTVKIKIVSKFQHGVNSFFPSFAVFRFQSVSVLYFLKTHCLQNF